MLTSSSAEEVKSKSLCTLANTYLTSVIIIEQNQHDDDNDDDYDNVCDDDNDDDDNDDDDCRGVNLSLRLLQDVFHVDRGIDW